MPIKRWPSNVRRAALRNVVARYLADTSAWVKSRQRSAPASVRRHFDELLLNDEIAICDVVALELLHHESTPAAFRKRRADLDALPWVPVGKAECARALEVQYSLAGRGGARHRGVKLPDYLIAASAELAGLAVLHYDGDYELVASETGQGHEWLAPRGSL